MQTREKYGTQARRLFKIIYEGKTEIWSFKEIFKKGREIGMTDSKKLIDTVFILEGLGFLTRISKNNFIFSGFRGMATRIIEGMINKLKKGQWARENWLFSDELLIDGKKVQLRQSVHLGNFYQEILATIFTISTKTLTREGIEKIQELIQLPNLKDMNLLVVLNEMISIMTTFNLLEKRNPTDNRSDTFEVYQWNGPEIFINKGLAFESLIYSHKIKDQLIQRVLLNIEKEKAYYNHIFRDLFEQSPYQTMFKNLAQKNITPANFDISQVPRAPLSHFPKLSYAMLKGKNWTYLIQKLLIIVGRSTDKNLNIKRDVDVELDSSTGISRQHAIINYNFQEDTQTFEIQCISQKKTIIVDSTILNHNDPPKPLLNKTHICIGKENFMFFLPNNFKPLQIEQLQINEEEKPIDLNEKIQKKIKLE